MLSEALVRPTGRGESIEAKRSTVCPAESCAMRTLLKPLRRPEVVFQR